MNIDHLRIIDQFVGQLSQWALVFAMAVIGFFRTPSLFDPEEPEDVERVLIIKFFGMGSLLLASPAMRKLKRRFPEAELVLFTLESNRKLCQHLPAVDRIICLDIRSPVRMVRTFIQYLEFVRQNRIDISFDFEFLTKFSANVTLLTRLFGNTRFAVGFSCPVSSRNHSFDECVIFDHSLHISEIYTKMINVVCQETDLTLDFQAENDALRAFGDPEYLDRLREEHPVLKSCGRLVGVNINTGPLSLQRRWPLESFEEVIRRLLAEPDVAILLIGGPDDATFVADFIKELPRAKGRVINLAGVTSLPQLIGLFTGIDLLICNDSGPLHYAHILGLTTVSFFGPETPRLYGPVGRNHRVFYLNASCSPCLNVFNSKMSVCEDNICLQRIDPERVAATALEILYPDDLYTDIPNNPS